MGIQDRPKMMSLSRTIVVVIVLHAVLAVLPGTQAQAESDGLLTVSELKKLRVRVLKEMLRVRGVECVGCTEKSEFVQRALESQHLKKRPPMTVVQEKRWDAAVKVAATSFESQANGSAVIQATHTDVNNWEELQRNHSQMFVLYYATWCEHCKHAKKPFADAAYAYATKYQVPFVAVDCGSNKVEISECGSIAGFPEFWFQSGEQNASFVASGMLMEDFEEFLDEHTGGAPSSPWKVHVTHIEAEKQITQLAASDPVGALVMFHAPWCSHCQQLKPEFTAAAEVLQNKMSFAAVDCTKHRPVCDAQLVKGFPTLRFFSSSDPTTSDEFMDDRTAKAILQYAGQLGVQVTDDMFELAEAMPGTAAGGAEESPAERPAFELHKSCYSCAEAGHGWCPIRRVCGGFANKNCRGDHTDYFVEFDKTHRRRVT